MRPTAKLFLLNWNNLMSEVIEQLYKIELELKTSLINNQDIDILTPTYTDLRNKLLEENKNINTKIDFGFDLFDSVKVPVDILRASSFYAMSGKITTYDRNLINSYFLNKFGKDVSNIDVLTLSKKVIPEHAEAFAMECGADAHYIGIPDNLEKSYLSYDLLVHEIGHTVEFTERRKNKTPADILTFGVLSEAIAHYYQMVYMLENSTKENRLGMLASTTQAYLFYRCVQIMFRVSPTARVFDPNLIINDSAFIELKQAYLGTDIIDVFFATHHNQDFRNLYQDIHAQRFGVFLALNFIKYKLDITEILNIKYPMGEISLEGQISQTNLEPDVLFNFSEMDETLTNFVNGSL